MNNFEKNLSLLKNLHLCCPKCKGQLNRTSNMFSCILCKKDFPIMYGIPDFRLFGDPYLGFKDDYNRTKLVAENMHHFDLAGLLKFYWSNSPETPDDLREKFVRTALLGESKAKEILKELPHCIRDANKETLEIGCGTGGFLVSAANRYKQIIGTDIALRWLTVCRKRLEEAKIDIPLICCCAEFLPFTNNYFDQIVACSTLEHTRNQLSVLNESYRVLNKNGNIFISTPNRFSLSVEPHVYLWGVGFLPRNLMESYVKLIKGVEYKNKRLLSLFELKRLLRKFKNVRISFPNIDKSSLNRFTPLERFQASVYLKIRKVFVFKIFLLFFGPMYYVLGQKKNSTHNKMLK